MKMMLSACAALLLSVTSLSAQEAWRGASWIWDQPGANSEAQTNDPRYVRRTFELAAKPKKAELRVTVDNEFVAHINGQTLGDSAEWQAPKTFDVTKHLVAGKNVFTLVARNHGGVAGIIAWLRITTADGKEQIVATDAKTRITQEIVKDWNQPSFDDSKWPLASVLGDASIGPWNISGNGGGAVAGGPGDVGAVDPKVKDRLSAEQQLKHFNFPKDFTLELVAADPLVINPVTMAIDEKGRIYVSESHTYRYGPSGSPIKPFANPLVRLDPLPDGKGYKRTLVAEGFDDPVMGIAVKGDKLWLTANNFLYTFDLAEDGKATNKQQILIDKNKAWNPFGMFVLEWGPDGLLYLSVGDHKIDIHGPDGTITGRANSGIIMRMNPDGTKMERLVHGMRVPYSFEYDPYGQLWVLSNGEGNPNRFIRVIDGVDYHCYSRGAVDNNWLAGNHPLAPPVFETLRGAHTQLMRYYGGAYPADYQGSLFLNNWGAHGFSGPNRAVFRYVPDERGKIVTKEPLLSCTDPHFRPSHIFLDPDGNLLVADWYGRDDESDMTGRIWRLKYTGKDRPENKFTIAGPDWAKDDYVVSALSSPNQLIRAKASDELVKRGEPLVKRVAEQASSAAEPLGAASALWVLARIGTSQAKELFAAGAGHKDAKVRRLAVNLARRYQTPNAAKIAQGLAKDADVGVRVEAALALATPAEIRTALVDALMNGAADDPYLRYEAAWHLGKNADEPTLAKLLASDAENERLAAMIAIDVAAFENFATKPAALAALNAALSIPGKADVTNLLMLAQLDGDAGTTAALQKLIARDDLPTAAIGRAVLVLRAKAGTLNNIGAVAGKRLLEAVEKGAVKLTTPADQLVLIELLDSEGPTDFAVKQVGPLLRNPNAEVRQGAHALARRYGAKAGALTEGLWTTVSDPRTKAEDAIEQLATIARIEAKIDTARWSKLLAHPDPLLRTEAVRWWRGFKGQPALVELLVREAPGLVKSDDGVRDDLAAVFRHLGTPAESVKSLNLPGAETDKAALTKQTMAELTNLPQPEQKKRALAGLQVFERAACTKCHTTATQTTVLAPSLKGIGGQKIDYLIESVLFPSKIIKTGFESETITTKDGKVFSGLVKDEGKVLRLINLDRDIRIPKDEVEERTVQRVSIMPEGQEAVLSRREFADLIAYLMTLR